MWARKRAHTKFLTLFVSETTRKFVVLVGSSVRGRQGTGERLLTVLKHVPRLPSSPFTGSAWATASLVIAFEVDFDTIVGIDYFNPLCQDGRFVIESSSVIKRVFATVPDAKLYYDCSLEEDSFQPAAAAGRQSQEQPQTRAAAQAASKQLSLTVSHSVPDLHTPRAAEWPSPASWTAPACTFTACTLIIWFTDPRLPDLLRPVIQGDEHLLKLYESGLPAWAVHMPHYGIFYRPWMRTVTWLLFVAISIFSLIMGFYDLYKNVPYLDQVLRGLAGSLHLPASTIFRWLDTHVVVRLSILCAYLFGKSPFAAYLLYWAAVAASCVRATMGPMVSGLATVLSPLGAVLKLMRQVLQPVFTVVRTGLQAPVLLAGAAFGYMRAFAVLVWQCLQAFGLLFRAGAKTAASGQALSSQAAWWLAATSLAIG
ncbi:hypothetical protein WJX73_010372 [Symbiochloris irregularis]|uniref:Uncharacterized protein n=1 Tax=Symbiochloris irregularis TaxID=706552 RepID=A0AAW1NT68_9CHLO